MVLNEMTMILIREVMGFHAEIDPRLGANGASCMYALGGCENFDHPTDKKCGINETRVHVSVDSWIGSYASAQKAFATDYPRLAGEDLGTMGYEGEESIYVSQEVLRTAYDDIGLALDFYKSCLDSILCRFLEFLCT